MLFKWLGGNKTKCFQKIFKLNVDFIAFVEDMSHSAIFNEDVSHSAIFNEDMSHNKTYGCLKIPPQSCVTLESSVKYFSFHVR